MFASVFLQLFFYQPPGVSYFYIRPLKSRSISFQLEPHCPYSKEPLPAIHSTQVNFKGVLLQLRSSVSPYTFWDDFGNFTVPQYVLNI